MPNVPVIAFCRISCSPVAAALTVASICVHVADADPGHYIRNRLKKRMRGVLGTHDLGRPAHAGPLE